MELIYCYIKDHKSLKNAEFNFSLDNEFKLKEEKNDGEKEWKYILVEKSKINKQPKNFFGKNIINLTGVVGKNGAGKTSLLEVLFREIIDNQFVKIGGGNYTEFSKIEPELLEVFLIYRNKDKYQYFSTLKNKVEIKAEDEKNNELICKFDPEEVIKRKEIIENFYRKEVSYLYIDDNLGSKGVPNKIRDGLKEEKEKKLDYNYSASELIKKESGNIFKYAQMDLKRVITFLIKYKKIKALKKNLNLTIPEKLFLGYKVNAGSWDIERFFNQMISETDIEELSFIHLEDRITRDEKKECIKKLKGLIKKHGEDILKEACEEERVEVKDFYSITDSQSEEKLDELGDIIAKKIEKKNIKSGEIREILFQNGINQRLKTKIKELINFYIYLYKPIEEKKYKNFTVDSKKGRIEINLNSNSNFDIKVFLNYFKYSPQSELLEEYKESLDYSYDKTLSSGERSMLTLLSKLYEIFYNKKMSKLQTNWLILLDEPEVMMHPEWQRKILNVIIEFINEREKNEFQCQLIMTSHSPYIVSDLPKENVILLNRKAENDVNIESSNISTFGANIYDLLANSFFINSSLGEFSKKKIKKVIELMNTKENGSESDQEINYIIDSIGEDLLRNRLKELRRELSNKGGSNK